MDEFIERVSPFYRNGDYVVLRVSANVGLGVDDPDTLLQLLNDAWLSAKNFAGTSYVNMLKVNVDDEIDVGGQLNIGAPTTGPKDGGQITIFDMPVSADPVALTEMSFTMKVDGDNVLTVGAFADSAGGVTGHFVKNHGADIRHRTDGGAAHYNPSILTSDYLIVVDNTAAARNVIISTEDVNSGSADNPRFFEIKDEYANAAANNITISLETGTIDGAANVVLSADKNAIRLYVTGTNGFVL